MNLESLNVKLLCHPGESSFTKAVGAALTGYGILNLHSSLEPVKLNAFLALGVFHVTQHWLRTDERIKKTVSL